MMDNRMSSNGVPGPGRRLELSLAVDLREDHRHSSLTVERFLNPESPCPTIYRAIGETHSVITCYGHGNRIITFGTMF